MNGSMALAFGALLGGAIIIDYGVKNAKGAFSGASNSTSSAPAAGTVTPSTVPSASAGKASQYGQVTYAEVAAIGSQHGWTKAQIDDWFYNLIPSESNGTLTDKNPTSDAIGIAQGITGPGWYAAHGGSFGTVTGQLTAMANYVDGRYGNPSAAWQFHLKNNYY